MSLFGLGKKKEEVKVEPAWKIHSHAYRGAGLINEEIAWFSSSINA